MNPRLSRALTVAGVLTATATLLLAAYTAYIVADAPPIKALQSATLAQASVIQSADGQVLGRFQQSQQEPVKLAQISPLVIQALIATEDHRFREHHGVDWRRSLQATLRTATGRMEGGSTLTQQLARNLFPEDIGRARNLNRKLKEIVTALRIERLYTKDQILEAYLNTVPFLYNAVGIEAAAHTYFDKPAIELDAAESATLVGMLKGTQYFNPVQHPDRALQRRNLVLRQMVKRQALPQSSYDAIKDEPLRLSFKPQQNDGPDVAPHFIAHVRKWLEEWADRTDHDLDSDGLVIHTTLDSRLQAEAVSAVERQTAALQQVANVEWSQKDLSVRSRALGDYAQAGKRLKAFDYFWRTHPRLLQETLRKTPQYQALRKSGKTDQAALAAVNQDDALMAKVRDTKTRLEAGLVAIDPNTGAVRAWVGSRDHDLEQFDHVAQAERQPGSTFKPIVYAAALERGIHPAKTYMDTPIEVNLGQGKVWRPTDMSGSTNLPMTMWEGLVYSKNTITTQVMQDAGLDNIAALARTMGITSSKLDTVPSMALGTSPVTLLEMASVYATIANEGQYRQPYFVDRITDKDGHVLAEFGPHPQQQALSQDSDHKLIDMMRGVIKQGTGTMLRSSFVGGDADLAGKTGTTQNNTDGWFMAMHPQLVVGAWVGFNDQHVTMRGSYWGQGGHNALLLVGDFMQRAVKQKQLDTKLAFSTPMLPPVIGAHDWNGSPDGIVEGNVASDDEVIEDPTTADPAGTAANDRAHGDPADEPRSALELGEVMKAMGRDPTTGAPVQRSPMAQGGE